MNARIDRSTPARVHRRRTGAAAAISLAAFGVLAAGCGDDDPNEANVVAVDFAFEDVPDQVDTETVFTLRNDSDVEVHEMVAFALPAGLDGTAAEILAMPEEELGAVFGGPPAMVIVVAPDGEEITVGDGTLSEPGRYILFCGIPTGADPEAFMAAAAESEGPPDVAGGPPHFVHGMATTIEVTEP